MKREIKKYSIIFVIFAAALIVLTAVLPVSLPALLLADFTVLSALGLFFVLRLMHISMRETLYSYRNICLIGGALFLLIFTAVLAFYLVSGISEGALDADYLFFALHDFPEYFTRYAVFVVIFICLLLGVSNIELMRREGFSPRNALSVLVAALFVGGTVFAYMLGEVLRLYILSPNGSRFDVLFMTLNITIPVFFMLLIGYFECILAGTAILGWLAVRRTPEYDKDFIIILGCSIDKKGGLLPLLRGRVNRAIRFAWEQEAATGKAAKFVPSGGQGSDEIMSEGAAMELYLLSHGAEADEIYPEKASVNTWENMLFSKRIIDKIKPNAKVAFATTNYHILRSGILAHHAGLDAEGIAGDTKWYFWPNGFVREFFGILAMNLHIHAAVAAAAAVLCVILGCVFYFM